MKRIFGRVERKRQEDNLKGHLMGGVCSMLRRNIRKQLGNLRVVVRIRFWNNL
jgi:hypothetical protein